MSWPGPPAAAAGPPRPVPPGCGAPSGARAWPHARGHPVSALAPEFSGLRSAPAPKRPIDRAMWRLARLAVNVGTGICVLGLSSAHAVAHGYSVTGSSRFAWSLGYLLVLDRGGVRIRAPRGPPDPPPGDRRRDRRHRHRGRVDLGVGAHRRRRAAPAGRGLRLRARARPLVRPVVPRRRRRPSGAQPNATASSSSATSTRSTLLAAELDRARSATRSSSLR